jgi:hypothetical protein
MYPCETVLLRRFSRVVIKFLLRPHFLIFIKVYLSESGSGGVDLWGINYLVKKIINRYIIGICKWMFFGEKIGQSLKLFEKPT